MQELGNRNEGACLGRFARAGPAHVQTFLGLAGFQVTIQGHERDGAALPQAAQAICLVAVMTVLWMISGCNVDQMWPGTALRSSGFRFHVVSQPLQNQHKGRDNTRD